ncbi:MAG: peptidylprolyl isomerase [Bacteroidales bacterium]|nr:peptidylprolyl isomerase [Bacteroidales bacterium]
MTIDNNKVVGLTYQLEVDGQIADQATAERPLEFIFGTGMLLPKFEENVKGLTTGDKYDFRLTAEEGYGPVEEQAIIDLPKSIFEVEGKIEEGLLVVGNTIPMMNSMGAVIPGKVVAVNAESVKMDFNHPMAGKALHFTGEVVSVREATAEELEKGLQRGCGGCGGNCGGNCGEGECGGDCSCDGECKEGK